MTAAVITAGSSSVRTAKYRPVNAWSRTLWWAFTSIEAQGHHRSNMAVASYQSARCCTTAVNSGWRTLLVPSSPPLSRGALPARPAFGFALMCVVDIIAAGDRVVLA
jgi:hypothetical protein